MPATTARSASLLDHDADFAAAVPAPERAAARALTAGTLVNVRSGRVSGLERLTARDDVLAVYLAGGVLLRETALGSASLPDLVGQGELLGPTANPDPPLALATATTCVEPATLLVLGQRYAEALGRWPGMLRVLERRRAAQHARISTLAAVGHLSRVDVRILAVLWLLAQSWGRVVAEGTVVPFPITHALLGRFVRAQRPTVSLAVAQLDERGLVARLDDGTWLLPEGSAAGLEELLGTTAEGEAMNVRGRVPRLPAPQDRDRRVRRDPVD